MVDSLDDISRKSRKKERDKMKKEVAEDITDVVEDVAQRVEDIFKRKQIRKQQRENGYKPSIAKKSIEIAWISGLVLLLVNFVLGNIWLFKTLIKSIIQR